MILNEIRKNTGLLNEVSLSRVLTHMKTDENFAFISAFIGEKKEDENNKAHNELKADLKELNLSYKIMPSGWRMDEKSSIELEKGIMIYKITKSEAMRLGNKYDQYSIFFKDKNKFLLIDLKDNNKETEFSKEKILTSKKGTEDAYSTTRHKKFSFEKKKVETDKDTK